MMPYNSVDPQEGLEIPYNSVTAVPQPIKFVATGSDEDNALYGFTPYWLLNFHFVEPFGPEAINPYPSRLNIDGMEFEFEKLDRKLELVVYRRIK